VPLKSFFLIEKRVSPLKNESRISLKERIEILNAIVYRLKCRSKKISLKTELIKN
jgi:hypothetical protein